MTDTRLLQRTLAALVLAATSGLALGAMQGAMADDPRLGERRTLDGHFPFTPPASREEWAMRAAALRRQVRVGLGLWPWPTRTPLNVVIHGAVMRDGYTVERVFFESLPGHFVTGSLYRPAGTGTKRPAVLSPHGHWPGGRFQDVDEAERKKQIASGAERFDNGARHVLQARAVQLARMGAVVFLYDMVGYADSVQIPQAIAHSARGRSRTDADGLFFSPAAELQLQSILGLQMWNAVRALDFLSGLPDVDASRIAVTGASGGGTQTFLLSAIDDRPAVAFPAVMVSARMQGGCTCENADYLRIGTGNVEFAALFAPKPLGMTAADDWTRTMPTDGFPQLQAHYALFGARDKVQLFPFLQFGHNYNGVSREAMYDWLNSHLGLGRPVPVRESDFVPLSREESTVWDAKHPAPQTGEAAERAVTSWWKADTELQLTRMRPRDAASWQAWRETVGGALDGLIARAAPSATDVTPTSDTPVRPGDVQGSTTTLRVAPYGEFVRIKIWAPEPAAAGITVLTSSGGLAAMAGPDGSASALVRRLLAAGQTVVALDMFGQDGDRVSGNRLVENRAAAAYTFGYNAPLVVERARDVVAALQHARGLAGSRRVTIAALDGPSSAWTALACAQAGRLADAAAFVTDRFRFASIRSFEDRSFLPGGAKYGDLPAALTLAAPSPLFVAGEDAEAVALLNDAYRAAGSADALRTSAAVGDPAVNELAGWIVGGGTRSAAQR